MKRKSFDDLLKAAKSQLSKKTAKLIESTQPKNRVKVLEEFLEKSDPNSDDYIIVDSLYSSLF